ncbi:MAG: translesion error-prone DNA polymerase V autoproteolytic subunit [Candidatus Electrothrix communis]|nr:MAG: translesion error-prone DNA polymerase V autoproteolytic subunit [Candidatus Electrothrix communis]
MNSKSGITGPDISRVYRAEQKKRVELPLFLGGVSAGFPSPAEDYTDGSLDLNELLITNQAATFFVRVDGESMTGAGIQHDDILVVDRSRQAEHNDIVIAVLDGELTVKRLVLDKGTARLVAENPAYPSIDIKNDEGCQIWGVVTSVIHQF